MADPSPAMALGPVGGPGHVDRLAFYLGLDADIVLEGLMLAAARDAALFGAASAAARRVRASSAPEAPVRRFMTA